MNRYLLFLTISLLLFSCKEKGAQKTSATIVKESCYVAMDERRYLEMTEYQVLKNEGKLRRMASSGSIVKLREGRKVKVLRKKIDIAEIEYRGRNGKRRGWIALKYLH